MQKAAVTDAEAAFAKANIEVAALAAKYASERTDTANASAAVAVEAPPPGYGSVSFAEEKWAEREAYFTQQLAQLQAMVAAQGDCGSEASEASPSIAGELASIEELENDEAWTKVASGKRKALLHRERDMLARKVRNSLGKVSSAASPFVKKTGP